MGAKYGKFAKKYGRRIAAGGYASYKSAKAIYSKYRGGKKTSKAVSIRGAGSGSKRRRRRYNQGHTTVSTGPGSSSFNKITYKKQKLSKVAKFIGNQSTVDRVDTGYSIAADGLQNCANFPAGIIHKSDIATAFANAARWYDSTAGTYNTQVYSTTTSSSKKLWIDSVQTELRWVNQAPSSCEIEFYIVASKVTSPTLTGPKVAWETGIDAQGMGTGMTQDQPYAQPFTSKTFTTAWRVVFKKKVILTPGAMHTHTFKFNVNRMIDTAYAVDYELIRGISYWGLWISRGVPADTSATKAMGDITLTGTKVIVVQRTIMKSRMISAFPKTYLQSSALDTTNTSIYVPGLGGDAPIDAEADAEFA